MNGLHLVTKTATNIWFFTTNQIIRISELNFMS
jgi:hypothetical protein